MEEFTSQEWNVIGSIQEILDHSPIVDSKIGVNTLDLAIEIFKVTKRERPIDHSGSTATLDWRDSRG